MATIKNFQDLEIWQLARKQVNGLNEVLKTSALAKDFNLKDQMISSAGSVMDCIAEGFERGGNKEFRHFLTLAKGSNGEFRSQLIRCMDKQYFETEKYNGLYENNILLGKKLHAFIGYLNRTEFKGFQYKKDYSK